jgi:hypothetical protein
MSKREPTRASATVLDGGSSEEWVFSLQTPSSTNSDINSEKDIASLVTHYLSSRDGAWSAPPTDELSVSPIHPHASSETEPLSEAADDEFDGPPSPKESVPLVKSRTPKTHTATAMDQGDKSSSTLHNKSTGWTFASPYWTLQSDVLLSITYFPAWQALAAYTNSSCACCSSHSSMCCGSCCASSTEDQTDFLCRQYTARDVLNVEIVPEYSEISGMGKCAALRVYLPNLPLLEDAQSRVPPHLAQAWQEAKARIHSNAASRKNSPML